MYYSPLATKDLMNNAIAGSYYRQNNIFSKYLNEHKYVYSSDEVDGLFTRQIYYEIIHSKAFQRLKKIHFLGAIDYLINPDGVKPNKRHTRYQHSLGVALLALQYSKYNQFSVSDEILCVVAALLHDIGHAPLSHSMEPVLKEKFYLNHHTASEKVVEGTTAIGKEINNILLRWNIEPSMILDIISGEGDAKFRDAFGLSINIDTIEAILRSQTYIYPNHLSATPSAVLKALIERNHDSRLLLDAFWNIKNEIYNKLINSKLGVLADYICQSYMVNNLSKYGEDFYFRTEDDLKHLEPNLFKTLKDLTTDGHITFLSSWNTIPCTKRTFYINNDIPLDSPHGINDRYSQQKIKSIMCIREFKRNEGQTYSFGESFKLFK
ncbi:MAG: HD domain-containing protein [Candidatus Thiodiazotropha sp.]